jgi:hypothetical protein
MNKTTLRMILGIGLMASFLNIVQVIYFFAKVSKNMNYDLLLTGMSMLMYQWMWIPNLCVMAVLYYVLVYKIPYEGKRK